MSFPLRKPAPTSSFPVFVSGMNVRSVSLLVSIFFAVIGPLHAKTADQWIAKARAYLGSESALNSVTTIHFTGTLETTDSDAPDDKTGLASQMAKLPAEIIFQKPYQQQMTVTRQASIDTMVLDGYDGWSRVTARENPKQWRITLLDVGQIKQLRANTWENLSFFAGLEAKGGTVQLEEDVTVDGIPCAKLSFIHSERIVFNRYFEKATGRLVKTETGNGSEIREEGEMNVGGIRFPKRIVNKSANGQVTTITIDTIVLNERIPPEQFAVPSLLSE